MIAAATIIWLTGWQWVDSVVGVAIGLWVLPRTLLRDATNVLLEGGAEGIDLDAVERAMLDTPGVRGMHDLHVWALSSGKVALSVHVEVEATFAREGRLEDALEPMLEARFGITHATVQAELPGAHDGRDPHAACATTTRARTNTAARGDHGHDRPSRPALGD